MAITKKSMRQFHPRKMVNDYFATMRLFVSPATSLGNQYELIVAGETTKG
jgi:hypothetical protein